MRTIMLIRGTEQLLVAKTRARPAHYSTGGVERGRARMRDARHIAFRSDSQHRFHPLEAAFPRLPGVDRGLNTPKGRCESMPVDTGELSKRSSSRAAASIS